MPTNCHIISTERAGWDQAILLRSGQLQPGSTGARPEGDIGAAG